MSIQNEQDWIDFKNQLDQEIQKRSEIKKFMLWSVITLLIFVNLLTAALVIANGTKINLLEKEIQLMNSVIVSQKKNIHIYCRQ